MQSNLKMHPLLFQSFHSFVRFAAGIVNVAISVALLLLFVISALYLSDSDSVSIPLLPRKTIRSEGPTIRCRSTS